MNKIELLKKRRAELLEKGKEIRAKISQICDENSFVELDAYSFSKNDFYGEEAQGEGVVTGYATVGDSPVYIVAQNSAVLSGGVSLANCSKIRKCLDRAYNNGYPVIYLFDSLGVQVGEGVNVLEGMAQVISASCELKGEVPQFSIVTGSLYGSLALVAANADYNFMLPGSKLCYASPLVVSASSGKNVNADEIADAKNGAKSGTTTFEVGDLSEAREKICEILEVLPDYSATFGDTDDDLNRSSDNLNEKFCPKCIEAAVFDEGKFIEMNKAFCPEVVTGIGRVGGISVAALIFDGGDKGVELTLDNVLKIKDFANFASDNSLPLVTFVDTLGIKADMKTNSTPILKEICNLVSALKCCDRLSVISGKAIGLGYTLFASKSLGVNYSYAFANAEVALFDGPASAAYFGEVRQDKLAELAERYSDENADPVNAAKNGYIDNIIEPRFVRQYVVSALQMIVG